MYTKWPPARKIWTDRRKKSEIVLKEMLQTDMEGRNKYLKMECLFSTSGLYFFCKHTVGTGAPDFPPYIFIVSDAPSGYNASGTRVSSLLQV
jgi:hypothetical protein